MVKFNTAAVAPIAVTKTTNTLTFEGAPSFKFDAPMELYQAVVTTMFGEAKFYEAGDERAKRIRRLVKKNVELGNADFVAKLAIYTRETMHLRSIPIFLTVTLAKEARDLKTPYANTRKLVARVIQRADEVREMFAAAQAVFGDGTNDKLFKRQCPRAIFKGISDACNKFDAYTFKKWSGGSGAVKFSDVFRVVHPTPKDAAQSAIYQMIMTDTLPAIDTWETKISGGGSTQENWQEMANGTMGYMARLRNLRNFAQNNVDLTNVISHLTNETAVANSKQLPFRFYSAYRELGGYKPQRSFYYREPVEQFFAPAELLTGVEDAFEMAVRNLPDLGNDVLIVVDQSGSMNSGISEKSTVLCSEIAAVLGAAVWRNQTNLGKRAMVAGFASRSKIYNWSTNTTALAAAKEMMQTDLGGATIVQTAWKAAQASGFNPETIIVLSDMQMTGDSGNGYFRGRHDKEMNPEDYNLVGTTTMKVSVNLQGYDNSPLAVNNGWYQLAGWSEKLFDLIESMRKPGDAIKVINDDVQF